MVSGGAVGSEGWDRGCQVLGFQTSYSYIFVHSKLSQHLFFSLSFSDAMTGNLLLRFVEGRSTCTHTHTSHSNQNSIHPPHQCCCHGNQVWLCLWVWKLLPSDRAEIVPLSLLFQNKSYFEGLIYESTLFTYCIYIIYNYHCHSEIYCITLPLFN